MRDSSTPARGPRERPAPVSPPGSGGLTLAAIVPAGDGAQTGWISKGYHRKQASACIVAELTFIGHHSATLEITVFG